MGKRAKEQEAIGDSVPVVLPTLLFKVEWTDAHFQYEWSDGSPEPEDYVVTTVGFLVYAFPGRFVALAAERADGAGGWRGVTFIPAENVKSMILLEGAS